MATKTLSTDKNGNVYYGPRTYADSVEWIDRHAANRGPVADSARAAAEMLRSAGYAGVAARIVREYSL